MFTCECPDCTDENNLLIGYSFGFNYNKLHSKKSKCKCEHPLFMGTILAMGKMSWGKNKNFAASKKKKPFGCPIGHSGVEEVPQKSERSARRAVR